MLIPLRSLCGFQTLAGEEGFEPPYPVLETGVLTVGRLPFTLSPRSGRRVSPLPLLHKLKLLFPPPTLNLFFPPPPSFTPSPELPPHQLTRPPFLSHPT